MPAVDRQNPRDAEDARDDADRHQVDAWAARFAASAPQELLGWAVERWARRLVLATAFQAEGLVLLDMAWRLDPHLRVLTLDTGRLPQETFTMIETVRERYGLEIEVVMPDAAAVLDLVRRRGPNLFQLSTADRRACCQVRKIEPLRRALSGAAAWIAGLRRDQSPSRADVPVVAWDAASHTVKLAPLARWSAEQVEAYTRRHRLPRHPLYRQGYASIGCAPCTRPVQPGDDPRAGRWWWEQEGAVRECGLHLSLRHGADPSDPIPVLTRTTADP